MKPIRVYQCKGVCCAGKPRRFWLVSLPARGVIQPFTSFRDASAYAGWEAARLPQEVTA